MRGVAVLWLSGMVQHLPHLDALLQSCPVADGSE